MHRKVILAAALLCIASPLYAQNAIATRNNTAIIAAANTYQSLLIAGSRRSLTIENNNATDSCWIEVSGLVAVGDTTATAKTINGVSVTAQKASIALLPGGSYTRYYPFIPNGAIVGTCASLGDSIYLDIQ